VYEHQLNDEELKSNLFWEHEIRLKLREQADQVKILAKRKCQIITFMALCGLQFLDTFFLAQPKLNFLFSLSNILPLQILAHKLLVEEKMRIMEESANCSRGNEDAAVAKEIMDLEDQFEEATRNRVEERDEKMARRLQESLEATTSKAIKNRKSDNENPRRANQQSSKSKLALIRTLIGRINERQSSK
jgi:hypothetical protein